MHNPWAMDKEDLIQDMVSNTVSGLTQAIAAERLKKFGHNKLTAPVIITFWGTFWEEVREPMILLLLSVGFLYSIWGNLADAVTIFVIIIVLVLIEVYTEYRAHISISALRKMVPATTTVVRDGSFRRLPVENVVKGDIISLEAGDRVPADARMLESFGMLVDESALTGESAPVAKEDRLIEEGAPVTDRMNMVMAGTVVSAGKGKALVTATAMETEIGKIHGLVQEIRQPRTPLQRLMHDLSVKLAYLAIFFSIIIPMVGILQGRPLKEMILTGLSLAFAVIPEELPIIITMVLALGGLALAKKHVLIRNLRSAETLGSVTVIVTDKTGTITENKMTVIRTVTNNNISTLPTKALSLSDVRLLKIGVLTTTIKKDPEGGYTGDPLDVALLNAAKGDGIVPEEIQSQYRKFGEYAFDSQRKMMSVIYYEVNGLVVYVKGAPEVILERCYRIAEQSGEREKTQNDAHVILKQAQELAGETMRVIAFAYKNIRDESIITRDEAESGLTYLGLVGIADPLRPSAAGAIEATRNAGIRTIMVSGDLPETTLKVAAAVGIGDGQSFISGRQLADMKTEEIVRKIETVSVFARINPVQKLDIVRALQASRQIVAVTGDGINDAPALKAADIGIAMGDKGTEAAREAAGMVLTDDSYSSIVDGVREGRRIYDNLKKGVMYYLSVKVALVLCFLVPLAMDKQFPFAPVQIVLLELFMDLAAAATFVAEPIEASSMHRPPGDPQRGFFDRSMLAGIILAAVSLSAAVLINYLWALTSAQGETVARTMAFATWLVGHIFLAFTMRSQRETIIKIGLVTNHVMLIWSIIVVIFLVAITLLIELNPLLKVTMLSSLQWLMVGVVPFVTVFWHEIAKCLKK